MATGKVILNSRTAHSTLARCFSKALDYRGTPFEGCVREIDLVFDTVGPDIVRRSWQVLKQGGRLVTIAVDSKSAADERVRGAFFIFEQDKMQLVEVGELLEAGKLRTAVDTVLLVSAATAAYAGTFARQGRGKLVISTHQWASLGSERPHAAEKRI